ncbi:MAG: class II fructose-bisphosphate aldolase [Defluviitaleaceae bacterium]|nr:class II fructose-bisphosphate aldolase [Defluviitaleaceae bacterium]
MLATTKEMLLKAQAGKYAVCAFNAENMEMAQAIVQAADALRAPVIIQTTPSTAQYGGLHVLYAMVSALAKKTGVPVALHLDHGDGFPLICRALREGYTSVMIDGSRLQFDQNAALTIQAALVAQASGVPIEAEIGYVGGKEDGLSNEAKTGLTDPYDAERFVKFTGVDSLAVGIGTAHGFYKQKPFIDTKRLAEINSRVGVPLVLHGATGLSDHVIVDCISNGICKINFATELRAVFTEAVRLTLSGTESIIDTKKYLSEGREAVFELAKKKIVLSGSKNKV